MLGTTSVISGPNGKAFGEQGALKGPETQLTECLHVRRARLRIAN